MEKIELKDIGCSIVHCPTEELANRVLKIAHKAGLKWSNGKSYINCNEWQGYNTKTAYNLLSGEYCSLNHYKERGYKVITAEEFLKLNTMEFKSVVTRKALSEIYPHDDFFERITKNAGQRD